MAGFFGMEILLYFRIYMRGGGQQFVVSLQVLVWLLSTYDINSSVIDSDCILVLLSIKFYTKEGKFFRHFLDGVKKVKHYHAVVFFIPQEIKIQLNALIISTKILSSRVLIMVET